jgi:tRNA dimethylallyltransferase
MPVNEPTNDRAKPLMVIAGPTGSGKSELALALAVQFQGEIVNCDSIQVYRGLEIGAAKTPLSDRQGIPHHLLDVLGPERELTAGEYLRLGRAAISAIAGRRPEKIPLVVGGTGFYLRALLEGLSVAPVRDDGLRLRLTRIAAKRPTTLHRWLQRADESASRRIHVNDKQKLIRALEMMLIEGEPLGEIQRRPKQPLTGYRTLKLGLLPERGALYARVEARCDRMLENGLIEETERLLTMGYRKDSTAMLSLGYKQAVDVLTGTKTRAEALAELKTKTRRYAKRQLTWFRADESMVWLAGFGGEASVIERARHLLEEHLERQS